MTSKYIKIIGTKIDNLLHTQILKDSSIEQNFEKIEQLLTSDSPEEDEQIVSSADMNPYHLSVNLGIDESVKRAKGVTSGEELSKNTDYFFYLKNIFLFWNVYLPKLQNDRDRSSDHSQRFESGNGKYKHAFFSMLTLVCLLLAILGICVYILKKNAGNLRNTSIL